MGLWFVQFYKNSVTILESNNPHTKYSSVLSPEKDCVQLHYEMKFRKQWLLKMIYLEFTLFPWGLLIQVIHQRVLFIRLFYSQTAHPDICKKIGILRNRAICTQISSYL